MEYASAELLGPVEGVDVDAERVLAQPLGVGRWLHDNREDGAPTLGRGERIVDIVALGPRHAETVVGSAHDARHLDRDLGLANLPEGIAGASVVIERQGAA